MKKLVYISPESFIDVDLPLIKEFNKIYDLLWIVTFVRDIEGITRFYSLEYVKNYCAINDIKNIIVEENRRSRNPLRIVTDYELIIKPIQIFKPDIIYFESFFDPYLPFIARICLGSGKTIIGLHDVEHHSNIGLSRRIIQTCIIGVFKYFHVFSETQASIFHSKYLVKSVRVAKLFLKDFGPPQNSKIRNGIITFLFFGRNSDYKGLDILIKAISLIPANLKGKYKVIIAGRCDNINDYADLMNDKDVYDFRLNFIKNDEIPSIFSEADYIVLPYRDVTQCGPLFIAFNYRLPAVVSNLSGFTEYIEDGINGFTFISEDFYDLSRILTYLINMKKEARDVLKNNISEFVNNKFNIEDTLKEYNEVFLQVV